MEKILKDILEEYIEKVEDVCNILLEGINYSENLNLKTKKDFFLFKNNCRKSEFKVNGINYILHGIGCVAFNEEMFIDWDFGYRSRWCGIDPWKVSMTLIKNHSNHTEYYDGNLIHTLCEQSVKNRIMFKKYNQYYFEMTEDETFKPLFPSDYDTLIIEYNDLTWIIPRNKLTDRFIRKSTRVCNQLDKYRDNYMLRFLLNGNEVYTIPYNDIIYPENAVKIMSDEILKNLLKS